MHAYLYPALSATPDIFSQIIAKVPTDKLDVPTHEGRFTPREVIAHLADWEVILREERIVAPVQSPGKSVNAYDEGELAAQKGYARMDVAEQLEILKAERAKTIAFLQSLSTEQLGSTMVHPERGVSMVEDLANMLVGHDVYHVKQLLDVTS